MSILSNFRNFRLNVLIAYNDENSTFLGTAARNARWIAKSIAIYSPENEGVKEKEVCFLKNNIVSNYSGQYCVIWDHWLPEALHEKIDSWSDISEKSYLGPFRPLTVNTAYTQRINVFLTDEDPDIYLKRLYGRIRNKFVNIIIYVTENSYVFKFYGGNSFEDVFVGSISNDDYEIEKLMNHLNLVHTFIDFDNTPYRRSDRNFSI